MGFMASAFAGGVAKGYLAGKERRRQNALAEREFNLKEKNYELQQAMLENDIKNNNLERKMEEASLAQEINDAQGLIRAGSGLIYTSAGDTEGTKYLHFDTKKGKDDKLDYEKTAFLNIQRLNNELKGPNGEALKAAIAENPEAWSQLVTGYYDGLSTFQGNLDEGELSRMYMLRLSPMSSTEMESGKTQDMELFSPLLDSFQSLGTAYNNKSLEEYIKERNQVQLANTFKRSDGSYAFYRHKDGRVSLIKKDAKKVGNINISEDQKRSLTKMGVIDFSNPQNKEFNSVFAVAQALNQVPNIDDSVRAGASVLFMEDNKINFADVASLGTGVSANSEDMGVLYDQTKNLMTEIIRESGTGYIPIAARKAMAKTIALGYFTKQVAPDTLIVDTTNNLTTARIKPNYLANAASPTVIGNAESQRTTARDGIAAVEYILNLQSQIPIEFLKSGQTGAGLFDTGYRIGKGLQNIKEFFSNIDTIFSGDQKLSAKTKSILADSFYTTESEITRSGYDVAAGIGTDYGAKVRQAQIDYKNNVDSLMIAKSEGVFLKAANGNQSLADDMFEKRMLIEASKIRLAFNLASLVQGGGAGGGRTISNADFEVIYNSLYRSGTGKTLVNALLRVRHELTKAEVRADNLFNYGGMGVHGDISAITDAYLDRAYSEANGLMRGGKAYIYDSNQSADVRSQDILATTQQAPEQRTLTNYNFSNINDENLSDLGLSKNDSEFQELANLSVNVNFNNPDENQKKINTQYDKKVIEYVLPNIATSLINDPSDPFKKGIDEFRGSYDLTNLDAAREDLRRKKPAKYISDELILPIRSDLISTLRLNVDRNGQMIGPNIPLDRATFLVDEFMYKYNDQDQIVGLNDSFLDALFQRIQQDELVRNY
jgi:hypothetical protein